MSYPRNAASPERVDIGAVIQISDGAVQTSGVAVKVIPQGGSEASGGGTIAYSADGIVYYLPTQAETNYTSFILIASKSGCIPASKTVVTSASGTAGYAGTDQSKIANPTSSVALTGTTIATTQKVDVETIKTQALTAAAGITFGVYVGGTAAAAVASTALSTAQWTNTLATNIGTTNTTVATNLDATVSSRLASASYTTPPTVAAIADAVWDEARAGHTTAGTFGFYLDAAISGISAGSGATAQQVWEYATRTLTGAVVLDSAVEAVINDIPNTAEFQARTLAAANYATASQINSLQVNTRASIQVPVEIETPDSGTQVWKIRLFLFDSDGNMEAPDSTPTVALVNASGTDRSSRLSAATALSTGAYSWDYTSTNDDAEEQLNWTFTVVDGGLTRIYPATSYVVEETAYRFTSTDRSTLNSRASSTEVTTVGTAVTAVSSKLGTPAGASMSADIASIKTDTGTTIPGLFTTITTKIRKFFQLSLRKDAAIATDNATELTELNANGGSGGGSYLNTTDSQEATVDRGNAAWTTGGGGGGGDSATLMLSTTIATVTSQTVLILTEGTGETDAYKDMLVIVTDQATATQKSRAMVASYAGNTKTLTLSAACTFTVAVGDTVEIVAVSGRTTEFTGTALTKLNTIQSSVVMQTGATGYSVVRPGGKIVLKAGDDYADDIVTTISLPVTDADEVVYDRLTAGDTATIKFAAGRNRQKNLIVGTVTKADVTKSAGVTYVPIEIARAQLVASTDPATNRVFNDYRYDIQVTTSGGKITTPVGGELEVEFDNAE